MIKLNYYFYSLIILSVFSFPFKLMAKSRTSNESTIFHRALLMLDAVNDFDNGFEEEIKVSAKNYINKLIIDPNGELKTDYLKQIEQITIYSFNNSSIQPTGSGSGKKTAVHLMNPATVYIDKKDISNASTEVKEVFIFHELLSSLGYWDENYQYSVGLWWYNLLNEYEKPLILNDARFSFLQNPKTKPNTLYQPRRNQDLTQSNGIEIQLISDSGGVTAIGGGGDWTLIDLKMELLKMAQNYFSKKFNLKRNDVRSFYFNLLTSEIEDSIGNYNIQYDGDGKIVKIINTNLVTNKNNKWSITTSSFLLKYDMDNKKIMLEDLFQKLLTLSEIAQ